ncbi:MAG: Na(+)/H(+) antiporter subunit D [Pseudomonadota bacterium]
MIDDVMANLSPGLILILGALLVPFLQDTPRRVWTLALPVLAFVHLVLLEQGTHGIFTMFTVELATLRIDPLSEVFGYIFLIAAFLGMLYQLHKSGWMEQVAGLIYAGSAIGAVFAGDLITLFLFWEGTAIASVFLIWAMRTPEAIAAGQRYLVMQISSGVLLLAGAMIHYGQTGSVAFESFDLNTLPGLLILIAFGIKAAFPLLNNWLQDAYPEATVTGTVILSAFTTKLAIYALARGYAGTEILVPIGLVMIVLPTIHAVIENDLRRVLSYSLNIQLGFMVVGIGIGSDLALAGAVAHAICGILYKCVLFMSLGAVLHRTGTAKSSELGGLYRSMPWTAAFCCIGAASISALPLFAGFISKSLIISAAIKDGDMVTWLILIFASAVVIQHSGLKIPFFAFFSRDNGLRPQEAPLNMLLAMGIASVLCVAIGIFPSAFYALLPYDVKYHVYTLEHVVTQMQLLILSAVVFAVTIRTGLYPRQVRSINLDTDWLWRKPGAWVVGGVFRALLASLAGATGKLAGASARLAKSLYHQHGPTGTLARTRPSGSMALWMTVLMVAFLVFSFF